MFLDTFKYFTNNEEDSYINSLIKLYTCQFNDDRINNPELKECLLAKIETFVTNKTLLKFYEKDQNLLRLLIEGILKHMADEERYYSASKLMCMIIKPLCFNESNLHNEKSRITEVTKQFLESNNQIFLEFMDNYNKLINKIMTNYTTVLTDCVNVLKIFNLAFY
jgi:hypothetical protein